jgi:hypothetical protein
MKKETASKEKDSNPWRSSDSITRHASLDPLSATQVLDFADFRSFLEIKTIKNLNPPHPRISAICRQICAVF